MENEEILDLELDNNGLEDWEIYDEEVLSPAIFEAREKLGIDDLDCENNGEFSEITTFFIGDNYDDSVDVENIEEKFPTKEELVNFLLDAFGHINESLNESLNIKDKEDDIIHPYIYLEDLDGNEIPSWNFAARIATAEDIDECCVFELARDLGYKIFYIEAPSFCRCVIAAKEVKAEDIQEEYADFLQGRSCVREYSK